MGNFLARTKVQEELLNTSIYSYTLRTLEGSSFPMENLRGKAIMVTNVASKCGYSKSYYNQLTRIHSIFKPFGFEIIGIPTREFMGQEFNDPKEIRKFADIYNVKFPLMELCKVNGPDALDFIQKLKRETPELYDKEKKELLPLKWNFSKFLIDKTGKIVVFKGTRTEPNELIPIIAEILEISDYNKLIEEYDKTQTNQNEYSEDVCPLKKKNSDSIHITPLK